VATERAADFFALEFFLALELALARRTDDYGVGRHEELPLLQPGLSVDNLSVSLYLE
jgi:hypothetical protein